MSHVLDGGNAPHTETELTNVLATEVKRRTIACEYDEEILSYTCNIDQYIKSSLTSRYTEQG